VHLHVIPRYHTPQMFGVIPCPVLDTLDGGNFRPASHVFEKIASALRDQLTPPGSEQKSCDDAGGDAR
jgi:hypothetical protein